MVTLLQITLILLKALGYLSWSWWAVFAPYIISGLLIITWVISAIVVGIRNKKWYKENFENDYETNNQILSKTTEKKMDTN